MRSPHRSLAAMTAVALAVGACASSDDSSDDSAPTVTDESESDADAETDSGAPAATEPPESEPAPDADGTTITLVTYESFPSEGTAVNDQLAAFTDDTGVEVEILVAGDTGTMLSKAELAVGNPEGDVMWGIDSTFLSRAVASGIFEEYTANGLDAIPTEFTDVAGFEFVTPVDFGDVCINYDIATLDSLGVAPPTTLDDLADPAYSDLLVVQNPATSSPGLAFLLATIDEYGADGWQDYWQGLVDNGVSVTDGWTDAYYGEFTYAGGDRPLVVSYGSSPPFEVLFAEEPLDAAPTGVVESTCYRQVEFVGVLAGTEQPEAAGQLIDFLISEPFQSTLPLDLFVFPVNSDVELDQTFVDFAVIPDESRSVSTQFIAENREALIDQWTDLVIG